MTENAPVIQVPPPDSDPGISFTDIALGFVYHRKLTGSIIGIAIAIGLMIAFLSPPQYTATALMVRESKSDDSNRSFANRVNLSGFGISSGNQPVGITPETYPDILKSREVLLAIGKSSFYFERHDEMLTLIDYYSRPPGIVGKILRGIKQVTIGLPGTLVKVARKLFRGTSSDGLNDSMYSPEAEELIATKLLSQLAVNVDRMTGIMSVSMTTRIPSLSSDITQSFIDHLIARVQDIYAYNSEKELSYFRNRLREADAGLVEAEHTLAGFIDRNWDPQTAKLKIELEGYRRKVKFKTELYSDLQAQLTQVELELKRSQPVITVLQAPFPPVVRSSPHRSRIMIFTLLLGILAAVVSVVIKLAVARSGTDEKTRAAWREIAQIVRWSRPFSWLNRFRSKPRN